MRKSKLWGAMVRIEAISARRQSDGPYDAERWAGDLAVLYRHIVVEVQE